MNIETWFLPTSYGDIRLHAEGDRTRVDLCKLTRAEREAVRALKDHSLSPGLLRSAWATADHWNKIAQVFEVGSDPATILLGAKIAKVQTVLTRALRRDRKVISVMTTKPGEFVEFKANDESGDAEPFRTAAPEPKSATIVPVTAVTVPAPVLGCPPPDFADAQIRASEVLRTFLSADQIADFEARQQFITTGALTGHRYAITSRHARSALHKTHRTVFDLDDDREMCVHDWDLPPAEEMLTMHLLLSLPNWEPYMRRVSEL